MGKLRVLIVDDSKISRVMIAEHLRETDFEVCGMAADAVEALKLYEELRPDFVTMDMNLPDTNGLECSRRILALDANARILMISAMKDLKLITQGKAVGVRAFLQKPVSQADLLDTLYLIGQVSATQETEFRESMQSRLHVPSSRVCRGSSIWRESRRLHPMSRAHSM